MLLSGNKLGTAMKMGMYAVGAATVLDAGQRMGENREAEKIKREQEYRLEQKKEETEG